jgi:hypothetical protein
MHILLEALLRYTITLDATGLRLGCYGVQVCIRQGEHSDEQVEYS